MAESLLGRTEGSSDVDVSIVKFISFVASLVFVSLLSGFFIASINSTSNLIYLLPALFLFWALFSLQVLFIKSVMRLGLAIFLESFAFFLPVLFIFKANFSQYFLWGFLVLFLMLLWATFSGRGEALNALKIPFWRILRGVITRAIPAVLAFIVVVYIFMSGKGIAEGSAEVASKYFLTPAINVYLPDFKYDMSIRDLIFQSAKKQIGEEEFNKLPQSAKDAAVMRTENLLISYTGKINTTVPIGESIYQFFSMRLNDSSLLAKTLIAFTLISFVWFFIKIITFVFCIPVALLAFVIYEMFIVTGFAAIQYETRSREIILLK